MLWSVLEKKHGPRPRAILLATPQIFLVGTDLGRYMIFFSYFNSAMC